MEEQNNTWSKEYAKQADEITGLREKIKNLQVTLEETKHEIKTKSDEFKNLEEFHSKDVS